VTTALLVLFALGCGVGLGWYLTTRYSSPSAEDPETELRALRDLHAGCSTRIRTLHMQLAQLEARLAVRNAGLEKAPAPVAPSEGEIAGAARLASLIDVLGAESEEVAVESEDEAAFMSILPADIVEEGVLKEPSDLPDRRRAREDADALGSAGEEVVEAAVDVTEEARVDRAARPPDQPAETEPIGAPPAFRVEGEPVEPEFVVDLRKVDDLTEIKGIGPKIAGILHDHGITTFDQLASLDESRIGELRKALGSFQSRIERDDWVGAARRLASETVSS